MQNFKGDADELKIIAMASPILDILSTNKDLFDDDMYSAPALGDLIFESERSPLSNAILQEIFRNSFKQIFDAFIAGGTFEAYLTVFRKIFGDDVEVTFTVPAAGKLVIEIASVDVELSDFVTRRIVDNQYIYDPMITQDGIDNIVFQTIQGFQSQYELEQMLHEMVPAGIWTDISLTVGGI